MQLDIWAVPTVISFSVQVAAGIAPMKWPQCRWLADVIFWGACLVAVCTLLLWAFSNREALMMFWEPRTVIAIGLAIAAAGVALAMASITDARSSNCAIRVPG